MARGTFYSTQPDPDRLETDPDRRNETRGYRRDANPSVPVLATIHTFAANEIFKIDCSEACCLWITTAGAAGAFANIFAIALGDDGQFITYQGALAGAGSAGNLFMRFAPVRKIQIRNGATGQTLQMVYTADPDFWIGPGWV